MVIFDFATVQIVKPVENFRHQKYGVNGSCWMLLRGYVGRIAMDFDWLLWYII